MTNPTNTELEEICRSIDEEERLVGEIAKCPAYDYVNGIGDFGGHIDLALRRLTEIVAHLRTTPDDIAQLREFAFLLFSIGSVHLSLESLLYDGAKYMKADVTLHPVIDSWKRSAPVQIVKSFRNRMQHGRYPIPTLSFEERTQFHAAGAGSSISVSLLESELDKIIAGIPERDGLRSNCLKFFEEKTKGQPAGIVNLVGEYRNGLTELGKALRLALVENQPSEFAKMKDLFEKLDLQRAIQQKHGVQDPRGHLIEAVETTARLWVSANRGERG